MEIREFAFHLLYTDQLNEKLRHPPADLTDAEPGVPHFCEVPARPAGLEIAARARRKKLPSVASLGDPRCRARYLHRFANHELMAFEMMTFALLAYPEAPAEFRRGLLRTIEDEQRHFQMYVKRMEQLGFELGEDPLNDHFWRLSSQLKTPLNYVAAMSLTFENANLDHASYYREKFLAVGDVQTALILEEVHRDEIHHVRFGVHWLKQFRLPHQSDYEAYVSALTWPNTPGRARGAVFDREARVLAGLNEEFISALELSPSEFRAWSEKMVREGSRASTDP